MAGSSDYSEDSLVEQPAIALFAELGYDTVNAFHEKLGEQGTLGRSDQGEVILRPRLRAALARLNPGMPGEALDSAVEEIARDRSALNPVTANREIYRLLKDGVKVRVPDETATRSTSPSASSTGTSPRRTTSSSPPSSGSPARSTSGAPTSSASSTACPWSSSS